MVREAFRLSGLDRQRFGTPHWNPVGALVPPGARIVIKPNWVLHVNQSGGSLDAVITHPAVLRPIIDYALLARPSSLIIGDAPVQGCDLETLWNSIGINTLREFYDSNGAAINWADFRRTIRKGEWVAETLRNQRETEDYVLVDLEDSSLLEEVSTDDGRFRVTMYDARELARSHARGIHRYLVARDILESDLIINVPKLKTHKKAGITGALKNLIGINGNKEFLPHHRKGSAAQGGDCYPEQSVLKATAEDCLDYANRSSGIHEASLRAAARACLAVARLTGHASQVEGGWSGNDTIWRTCLDLNRIVQYGRLDGTLTSKPSRAVLNVTDAFIAGDGQGPLQPDSVAAGWITMATSPAAADYVHAGLMGFDWRRIPIVREAFAEFSHPIAGCSADDVVVVTHGGTSLRSLTESRRVPFRAPKGWESIRQSGDRR
jgi:uncharacterized protein (DUF362 family)